MKGDPNHLREVSVRSCVAGGGAAGMMLAFLLARTRIGVLVLEKHADFLRDIRGDTIHPSTLEVMHELGVLEEFLRRLHQEVRTLGAQIGDVFLQLADFAHLPTRCQFIALMPQWHFLSFIAEQAKRYPSFRLHMEAEATALIEEGGRGTGVQAEPRQGSLAVRADLVVGADERHSIVHQKAGLEIVDRRPDHSWDLPDQSRPHHPALVERPLPADAHVLIREFKANRHSMAYFHIPNRERSSLSTRALSATPMTSPATRLPITESLFLNFTGENCFH